MVTAAQMESVITAEPLIFCTMPNESCFTFKFALLVCEIFGRACPVGA